MWVKVSRADVKPGQLYKLVQFGELFTNICMNGFVIKSLYSNEDVKYICMDSTGRLRYGDADGEVLVEKKMFFQDLKPFQKFKRVGISEARHKLSGNHYCNEQGQVYTNYDNPEVEVIE